MATKFGQNPIVQLRLATRKTGEEFAASLGLSVGAIRNIERGKLKPGPATLERMFISYGVWTDSISSKKGTPLYVRTKSPYTWESYVDWKHVTRLSQEGSNERVRHELKRLNWFLRAAALHGSLFQIIFDLERSLEGMTKHYNLEELINNIIRQDGAEETWFRMDTGIIGVVDHVLAQLESEQTSDSAASKLEQGSPPSFQTRDKKA